MSESRSFLRPSRSSLLSSEWMVHFVMLASDGKSTLVPQRSLTRDEYIREDWLRDVILILNDVVFVQNFVQKDRFPSSISQSSR
jgi:hypothetical protein